MPYFSVPLPALRKQQAPAEKQRMLLRDNARHAFIMAARAHLSLLEEGTHELLRPGIAELFFYHL